MGRDKGTKQRSKKRSEKAKKLDRKQKLNNSGNGDESTADLTSTAAPSLPQTPVPVVPSKESQSPHPTYHDDSQASVVSELTWVDSDAPSNKRSLPPATHTQTPPPPSISAQGHQGSFPEENVSYRLPHASTPQGRGKAADASLQTEDSHSSIVSELTWMESSEARSSRALSTQSRSMSSLVEVDKVGFIPEEDFGYKLPHSSATSIRESLPRPSSMHDSQSSLVSELTWHESSDGSSARYVGYSGGRRVSCPKQSQRNLLDHSATSSASRRTPSNDQSSIISDLTWLGSQRSIRPPRSSLAARIPESPWKEEEDASSSENTSSSGGSRIRKKLNTSGGSPRISGGRRNKGRKSKKKNATRKKKDYAASPRVSKSRTATRRGSNDKGVPSPIPYSPRTEPTRRRSMESSGYPNSRVERTCAPRRRSMDYKPEPPRLAKESPKAVFRKKRIDSQRSSVGSSQRSLTVNSSAFDGSSSSPSYSKRRPASSSLLSADSPKPTRPAWQLREESKQDSSRKSVSFADGKQAQEKGPPAFSLIRDWSERNLDKQPSFTKASASRVSPPRKNLAPTPPIRIRKGHNNKRMNPLGGSLDSCLLDVSQHEDRAPVKPTHSRSSSDLGELLPPPPPPPSTPSTPKMKLFVSPRGQTPRKTGGKRSHMKRMAESKNRRCSVNESMRNLMDDPTAMNIE